MSIVIWYMSEQQMWWYSVIWEGKEEMGSRRTMTECYQAADTFISKQIVIEHA